MCAYRRRRKVCKMEQQIFSKDVLTSISAAFVLVSVALSWMSFRAAEVGSTPDSFPQASFGIDLDFDQTVIEYGERDRARLYAKLLFNLSAMFLAASVLVDLAKDSSGAIGVGLTGLAGLSVVVDVAYLGISTAKAYRQRSETAFDSFYVGRGVGKFYRNAPAIRKLFFSMNSLAPWRLFDSTWESTLKYPTPEQLLSADRGDSAAVQ
jgi:hypothetical protein